jgi:hypothetical protein
LRERLIVVNGEAEEFGGDGVSCDMIKKGERRQESQSQSVGGT